MICFVLIRFIVAWVLSATEGVKSVKARNDASPALGEFMKVRLLHGAQNCLTKKVNFMESKSIYHVKVEVNNNGWDSDLHFFRSYKDAEEYLIKIAARNIWYLRSHGFKVYSLYRWDDGHGNLHSVSFRVWSGKYSDPFNYYDMRIFDEPLWNDFKDFSKNCGVINPLTPQ